MMSVGTPLQSFRQVKRRPEGFALLCYYDPMGIGTIPQNIAYVQSLSEFPIAVLNLFEHRRGATGLSMSPSVDINEYQGVIVHNTVAYSVDNVRSLDLFSAQKLASYDGVKVLMRQDENFGFREMADCIRDIGFDVILTCLPDEAWPQVYPSSKVGSPIFKRMLTGYVTPPMRSLDYPLEPRPIDIGYRGSIQPLSFGRLAFEKRKIGDDVSSLTADRGLALDISSRWEDRIGGERWLDFLGGCKATLGAESGASVFDVHGDLEVRLKTIQSRLGPWSEDHAYAENFLEELADLEGAIAYQQVSPRHFEAAATGTLQLMYPGAYSGIFLPNVHYFPLSRDYSNLDEAIALTLDVCRREAIVEAAREEIILVPEYWIETFVEEFDALLLIALENKGQLRRPRTVSPRAHHILLLAAHDPRVDPRLGWIEESAPTDILVHQVGVLPNAGQREVFRVSKRGALYWALPRDRYQRGDWETLYQLVCTDAAGVAAVQELQFLTTVQQMPDAKLCQLFSAPLSHSRIGDFRWYLRYLVDTAVTLIRAGACGSVPQAIISTDLDTLLAALVLKGMFKVPVYYDAHEYWPESDVRSLEFEKQFWVALEGRLLQHVDYCQTVSPGLASHMSRLYGKNFESVPNCEPSDRRLTIVRTQRRSDSCCRFLFMGNFAPRRGIELMIRHWEKTDEKCVLLLQGPDSAFKREMLQLAEETGLYANRILFPEPVAEDALVLSASKADVGVVPYTAAGMNYKHCSPNKLSQYMAAGIPIVANDTNFVRTVVNAAQCGVIVNFENSEAFVTAINTLANDRAERDRMGEAGNEYFAEAFNWNVVSTPLYQRMQRDLANQGKRQLAIFAVDHLARGAKQDVGDDSGGGIVRSVGKRPTTQERAELILKPRHSLQARYLSRIVESLMPVWRRLPPGVRKWIHPIVRWMRQ